MGWLFAGVFLCVALSHLGLAVRWYVYAKSASLVPLVGGLAGVAACFTLPFPALRRWWWTPLIVDLGSAYLVATTLVFYIRQAHKGRHSENPGRSVTEKNL